MLLLVAFLSSASTESTVVTSHQKNYVINGTMPALGWIYCHRIFPVVWSKSTLNFYTFLFSPLSLYGGADCGNNDVVATSSEYCWLLNRPINQTVDQSLRSFNNSFSPLFSRRPFSLYYTLLSISTSIPSAGSSALHRSRLGKFLVRSSTICKFAV